MIEQRNKLVNGQNKFRTVVSEVSSFDGNPVLSAGVKLFGNLCFLSEFSKSWNESLKIYNFLRNFELPKPFQNAKHYFLQTYVFRTKNLEHKLQRFWTKITLLI